MRAVIVCLGEQCGTRLRRCGRGCWAGPQRGTFASLDEQSGRSNSSRWVFDAQRSLWLPLAGARVGSRFGGVAHSVPPSEPPRELENRSRHTRLCNSARVRGGPFVLICSAFACAWALRFSSRFCCARRLRSNSRFSRSCASRACCSFSSAALFLQSHGERERGKSQTKASSCALTNCT